MGGHGTEAEYEKPSLRDFDGLNIPNSVFTLEGFREAVSYQPDERDIFVSTYPKSGTTWMCYIVWSILNGGAEPPNFVELNTKHVTLLALEGVDGLSSKSCPR
jgi:hypothetical protein